MKRFNWTMPRSTKGSAAVSALVLLLLPLPLVLANNPPTATWVAVACLLVAVALMIGRDDRSPVRRRKEALARAATLSRGDSRQCASRQAEAATQHHAGDKAAHRNHSRHPWQPLDGFTLSGPR